MACAAIQWIRHCVRTSVWHRIFAREPLGVAIKTQGKSVVNACKHLVHVTSNRNRRQIPWIAGICLNLVCQSLMFRSNQLDIAISHEKPNSANLGSVFYRTEIESSCFLRWYFPSCGVISCCGAIKSNRILNSHLNHTKKGILSKSIRKTGVSSQAVKKKLDLWNTTKRDSKLAVTNPPCLTGEEMTPGFRR